MEAFYPGAMKQAASFSTKCPKGNDIHQEFGQTFLEESVKIALRFVYLILSSCSSPSVVALASFSKSVGSHKSLPRFSACSLKHLRRKLQEVVDSGHKGHHLPALLSHFSVELTGQLPVITGHTRKCLAAKQKGTREGLAVLFMPHK